MRSSCQNIGQRERARAYTVHVSSLLSVRPYESKYSSRRSPRLPVCLALPPVLTPWKEPREYQRDSQSSSDMMHKAAPCMQNDGAIAVPELLQRPILHHMKTMQAEIMSTVYHKDKQRFRLLMRNGVLYAGATQGHSLEVEDALVMAPTALRHLPMRPAHATQYVHYASTIEKGTCAGQQRHVRWEQDEHLPKTMITMPDTEFLDTLYSDTMEP